MPINRILSFLAFFSILLFTLGSLTGCSCGDDDDDDDNDDAGEDDDDATDDDDSDDDDSDDDDSGDDDTTDDDEPPVITNTTDWEDTVDSTGPYTINTDVTDDVGLDSASLFYQVDGGEYTEVAIVSKSKATYSADIPGQAGGSSIRYYISATDTVSQTTTDPATAPEDVFSFNIYTERDIIYDDGTVETSKDPAEIGSYAFVRFTPESYPAHLITISYWGSSTMDLGEVEPYVIYDEDGGDPPDIADAFSVGNAFAPAVLNEFVDVDVSGEAGLATPLTSGDFYVGFKNTVWDVFSHRVLWGWDNSSTETRSWLWEVGDSEWRNVNDYHLQAGTWMFRVTVLSP